MQSGPDSLKNILFGGTLADKLSTSGMNFTELDWSLSEALPGVLEAPARSGALTSKTIAGASFPKMSELKDASARGRLLHYFANHELLAIETMAYVLLRFPEADPSFRRGVFHTLQDEQRHLQQYLVRMRELGVELGDVPLNLYFWNSLKNMKSPLDYVTQMSLTFEQANLDFALHFAEFFETGFQDEVTAKLLREVHNDEIKHVSHGLKWFNAWRTQDHADASPQSSKAESEYESYLRLLPYPMTPRRAKGGHVFSAESRKEAGMSDEFVESIRVSGGSRGKVPNLYFFNPQCEIEKTYPKLNAAMQAKVNDLAPLQLWLAGEEDVVELAVRPPLAWLSEIHGHKEELPELITPPLSLDRYAAFDEFKPWGYGESAWMKFSQVQAKVRRPPAFSKDLHRKNLFSKIYWKRVLEGAEQAEQLITESGEISSTAEIIPTSYVSSAHPHTSEVLLKTDQSTSGRGHQRIPRGQLSDPGFQEKLAKREAKGDSYLIEPFLTKAHDFSVNYELTASGKLVEFDPRFFRVDAQFQYQGAYLGRVIEDSAFQASQKCVELERKQWRAEHEKVIQNLRSLQYVGPFGIDALVYERQGGGLAIEAVIEVNVRMTMGRVALEIEKALSKKHPKLHGFWVFLHEQDLVRFGCRDFKQLETKLRSEFGDQFVATTPSTASLTWTFALLDQSAIDRMLNLC